MYLSLIHTDSVSIVWYREHSSNIKSIAKPISQLIVCTTRLYVSMAYVHKLHMAYVRMMHVRMSHECSDCIKSVNLESKNDIIKI